MPVSAETLTIAQSAQVSGAMRISNVDEIGIWCGVITSCTIIPLVSPDESVTDATSANFVRVSATANSGSDGTQAWTWTVGGGSLATTLSKDVVRPWAWLKLEASVAQNSATNFIVVYQS